MGTNTDILNAFLDKFELEDILPISYPNVDYDGDKPYMKIDIIPAQTQSLGFSSIDRWSGICQASVVVDASLGAITVSDYVDSIIEAFPRPTRISSGDTSVKIDVTGWSSPAIQGTDGYMIPVSIPYLILN